MCVYVFVFVFLSIGSGFVKFQLRVQAPSGVQLEARVDNCLFIVLLEYVVLDYIDISIFLHGFIKISVWLLFVGRMCF